MLPKVVGEHSHPNCTATARRWRQLGGGAAVEAAAVAAAVAAAGQCDSGGSLAAAAAARLRRTVRWRLLHIVVLSVLLRAIR